MHNIPSSMELFQRYYTAHPSTTDEQVSTTFIWIVPALPKL